MNSFILFFILFSSGFAYGASKCQGVFANSKTKGVVSRLIIAIQNGDNFQFQKELGQLHPVAGRNQSFLIIAAQYKQWNMFNNLLEVGVNPNTLDSKGRTPLHHIISNQDMSPESVRKQLLSFLLLIMKASDIINVKDNTGMYPIHYAVKYNFLEMLLLILEYGMFSIDLKNAEGKTALDMSIDLENKEIEKVLKRAQQNQLILQNVISYSSISFKNLSPVKRFHKLIETRDLSKVSAYFKEHGKVVINSRNSLGQTALHIAAISEDADIAAFLLGNGANPTAKDLENKTPYDYAKETGDESLQQILGRKHQRLSI